MAKYRETSSRWWTANSGSVSGGAEGVGSRQPLESESKGSVLRNRGVQDRVFFLIGLCPVKMGWGFHDRFGMDVRNFFLCRCAEFFGT